MGRRINDGDLTGVKQDKFRNSRFEYEEERDFTHFGGVSRSTPNTLGGVFNENRGRRYADESARSKWDGSPFENGKNYNWKRREGWDQYYNQNYDREDRGRGGALIGHDIGHFGKGPKGYKRPDDSIFQDVCDRLSLSPTVDASDIEVSVKDGVVSLNGNVPDRRTKREAELEIENISGVIDVQNFLSFKNKNEGLH